jgi:hypothetical protein
MEEVTVKSEVYIVAFDPLRNGKGDRARSKSRICGSTGHSVSYIPYSCVRERQRERVSEKMETWGDCVERQKEEENFG